MDEIAVKCIKCKNYFDKGLGVCPFCGKMYDEYETECFEDYENASKEHEKIFDNNRSEDENCVVIDRRTNTVTNGAVTTRKFSIGKTVAIIAAAVIVVLGILYIANLKRCSQCGKLFDKGYTVFGEYYCEECFRS